MSKAKLAKEALMRYHKKTEEADYFYLNAQELIDDLNKLFDVVPPKPPTITIEEVQYI